jgi:tRNA1Val (adenine37-N6)-methyltransferase
VFKFKQFEIQHDRSTFKTGTDAVLLGAWTSVPYSCKRILDIGSGCGVISLMLAQRSNALITGVDIDKQSVEESVENANNSLWKDRIKFINSSIQNFCTPENKHIFDLIVSNPPFFVNSLKSPVYERNICRHTDTLSFEELILSVDYCLSSTGLFSVIIPAASKDTLLQLCKKQGLFCVKILQIQPTENKSVNRVIMLFSKEEKELIIENITLRNASMEYTQAYKILTREFYLHF